MEEEHRDSGWKRWFRPETYAYQPQSTALRMAKKVVVAVVGGTVVLLGILMIITPGPAVVVIPAGLAILAIEFAWAKRWLRRVRSYTKLATRRVKRGRKKD